MTTKHRTRTAQEIITDCLLTTTRMAFVPTTTVYSDPDIKIEMHVYGVFSNNPMVKFLGTRKRDNVKMMHSTVEALVHNLVPND